MNCQRRSARPTRSAGAKPLRPAGWGQKVTFEKCKPLSCCCCCRIPIMVENVGLLIFLRESASATAVPGAPRSSATAATPTKHNKALPARDVNFVIAIPPPHMRGLELHAPTHCNPPPRWADACDRHPKRSACVSDSNEEKKAAQPPLVTCRVLSNHS